MRADLPSLLPSPPRSRNLWAGRLLSVTLSLLLLIVFLVPLGMLLTDTRLLSVASDSMTPTLRRGDLLLSRSVTPGSAKAGDIITFRDPGGRGFTITHRVMQVRKDGQLYKFVTKGDANTVSEHWRILATGRIAQTALIVPGAGKPALGVLTSPSRFLFAGGLIVLALGFAFLTIWRPRHPRR